MAMYTKDEIAVALRRCGDGICNDECPFALNPDCDGALMRAAAELLEGENND